MDYKMFKNRSSNNWMVAAAAFTLFQAMVHMFVSVVGLLQHACQLDWLRSTPTALFIRILYFHNPECGASVNIGQVISALPDQALVLMPSEPFTTQRARWFMFAYLALGAVWFAASLLLIVGAQRRARGTSCLCYWSPWLVVTGLSLFADFVGVATFLSDAWRTNTLSGMMTYIGGTASGLGGQEVGGTWAAAVVMGAYFGRAGVGWALHLLLFVLVFSYATRLRAPEEVEDAEQARKQERAAAPADPPAAELPPSPRYVRRAAQPAPTARHEPRHEPRHETHHEPRQEPRRPLRRADRIDEDPPTERVLFPDSLLSLPQRLELVMAEQEAMRRIDTTRNVGRADAAADRAETTARAAAAVPRPDESPDLEAGRGAAARGQLPWSYVPAGAGQQPHRMRDQLPPDEELPPVPVPDYTLRPKRAFTSLFRGGSTASASTAASAAQPPPPPPHQADSQLPTSSNPDWRSNDVLY